MEVIPLHAVLTTCCFFVMAVLGYTEFDYFLTVLTPVHVIFYIYGRKIGNKKYDWRIMMDSENVKIKFGIAF